MWKSVSDPCRILSEDVLQFVQILNVSHDNKVCCDQRSSKDSQLLGCLSSLGKLIVVLINALRAHIKMLVFLEKYLQSSKSYCPK